MRSTKWDSDRDISQALVDACNGAGGQVALGPAGFERFIAAARFHRVAPLAHSLLRQTGHPDLKALEGDRLRAIATHLQACAALDQLASVLVGVEWATFKGAVFSELAHPVPGLRTYNDVDVLVAPSSLREVCRRLREAGWHLADYRDMLRSEEPPGEMHWVSPGGVLIDLHWSMINMHSRRQLFDVSTIELLDRRVPVTLGSSQVWTLAPSDALVHACLHAALAGGNKLVYLVDVDRLSRTITDWDDVTARAHQWRAEVQVALVLGRAQRVLGTQVPADLDSRLGVPRPIRAVLALTDRVAPVPNGREDAGLARFVARAVRRSTVETMRAATRNGARGLKERAVRESDDARDRLGADETSLEIYLAAVESAAGSPV